MECVTGPLSAAEGTILLFDRPLPRSSERRRNDLSAIMVAILTGPSSDPTGRLENFLLSGPVAVQGFGGLHLEFNNEASHLPSASSH